MNRHNKKCTATPVAEWVLLALERASPCTCNISVCAVLAATYACSDLCMKQERHRQTDTEGTKDGGTEERKEGWREKAEGGRHAHAAQAPPSHPSIHQSNAHAFTHSRHTHRDTHFVSDTMLIRSFCYR
mmetsp:Transcript_39572/g.99107  ORF Transcript_39572/g.99107 Transcript_39572/m.99107 type:complete len:129 (-) Transcript_39572:256-642(-)